MHIYETEDYIWQLGAYTVKPGGEEWKVGGGHLGCVSTEDTH